MGLKTRTRATTDPSIWPEKLHFLCSRGLDLVQTAEQTFALVDAFGCASLPFQVSSPAQLEGAAKALANISPVLSSDGTFLGTQSHWRDQPRLPWALEEPLVARIPDSYRLWLCGRGARHKFDATLAILPAAYLDSGWGRGTRTVFEEIHTRMLNGSLPQSKYITKDMLLARIHHLHLKRMCDDLLALVTRALGALHRVLRLVRKAIREQSGVLVDLDGNELIHTGPLSHEIATWITTAVTSATTSLDVLTKLVAFINDTELPPGRLRPARGLHFSGLSKLRPKALAASDLRAIQDAWEHKDSLKELIHWRHDLVHNTTALEVERSLYIGFGTACINDLPLHYSQIHARDVDGTGQPIRYLARDYFTAQDRDIEVALHAWCDDVISGHATTARILHDFIERQRKNAQHSLDGI